jgi:hypothetical protein
VKYALCNESMDATLKEVRPPARVRWSIELGFCEYTKYIRLEHYEVMFGPGWRWHILFTDIAHLFINKLR